MRRWDLHRLCLRVRRGVAGHSACAAIGRQGVGRISYLYPCMRGPYKKIDAALGDRKR